MSLYGLNEVIRIIETSATYEEVAARIDEFERAYQAELGREKWKALAFVLLLCGAAFVVSLLV